ncbi:MFS general substrate transporter [Fomitiporia mediterranea MF3/22]|uniref:MFS general substrate transporter n=1 Tax=Fomitiporia mediterranea (strain MF3/22) TaxID=694068 RepID=UPI0004407F5C|nr:MFS general substrate transporter [Fomitiporia mediterranea MF3/22]EJD07346.1 MFS general substrate transporter [Fomitiporia mediterranea MF3/22]
MSTIQELLNTKPTEGEALAANVEMTTQCARKSFTRSTSGLYDSKAVDVATREVPADGGVVLQEKDEGNTAAGMEGPPDLWFLGSSYLQCSWSIGIVIRATSNVYLNEILSFGKVLVLGALAQVLGYALMAPALPFLAFCIAFFINGWGYPFNNTNNHSKDAQSNRFVARLSENSSAKMGTMHAIYGFGAVCSPFATTQFAQMPRHWSYHFIISTGIAIINTIFLLLTFKGKTMDAATEQGTSEDSKYKQIMTQKVVHPLAFFSLVYVGWTISYLQKHRGGGSSSGYVSTGFFGGTFFFLVQESIIRSVLAEGLTLGRVLLVWVDEKVGEHLIIYIYILAALGLELVVWLAPNLIADAVAVSFVGFILGPMYPILMNEAGRLIPQWLLTGSIGWIASFGCAGSAIFPFATGALAERFGIVSLQPLLVVLYGVLFALWLFVPDGTRRTA